MVQFCDYFYSPRVVHLQPVAIFFCHQWQITPGICHQLILVANSDFSVAHFLPPRHHWPSLQLTCDNNRRYFCSVKSYKHLMRNVHELLRNVHELCLIGREEVSRSIWLRTAHPAYWVYYLVFLTYFSAQHTRLLWSQANTMSGNLAHTLPNKKLDQQSTELRYQVTWIILIQYAIAMPPGGWLCTFWQIDDDKLMMQIFTIIADQLHVHVTCGRLPGNVTW